MWYLQQQWRSRLVAESLLMAERFPDFSLMQHPDGRLQWIGELKPAGNRRFVVSLTYPARYPYAEPVLRVEHPALRTGCPHVYQGGDLCVHRTGWDPLRGTAASEVPLAAAWIVGYLHWLESGQPW